MFRPALVVTVFLVVAKNVWSVRLERYITEEKCCGPKSVVVGSVNIMELFLIYVWFQSSLWSLSYLQAFPCCWHGPHHCQTCLYALISSLYLPSLHPCLWSFWQTENRQWDSGWRHLCCAVLQASVPEWFKCSRFLRRPKHRQACSVLLLPVWRCRAEIQSSFQVMFPPHSYKMLGEETFSLGVFTSELWWWTLKIEEIRIIFWKCSLT